eukprot:6205329-Pleurochrysis_carterae.AAC.2
MSGGTHRGTSAASRKRRSRGAGLGRLDILEDVLGWMLEGVLGASATCCAEQSGCSSYQLVGRRKFVGVSGVKVGYTERADRRRVTRQTESVSRETENVEQATKRLPRRTRRRRSAAASALAQNRGGDCGRHAPPIGTECSDAVGPRKRAREEEQNAATCARKPDDVVGGAHIVRRTGLSAVRQPGGVSGHGRLRRNAGGGNARRFRTPREVRLVKVDVRGDDDAVAGDKRAKFIGRQAVASQVNADPGAGFYACCGDSGARFDGVRAAPERQNARDGVLLARGKLVQGFVATWRAECAVEGVHGVRDGMVPVTRGRCGSEEEGTSELHDGPDGPDSALRDAEFACVVGMKRPDDLTWLVRVFIHERGNGSNEAFDMSRGFCFRYRRRSPFVSRKGLASDRKPLP